MSLNRLSKYNNIWLGIAIGLTLPVLGFFLSREIKLPAATVSEYWSIFTNSTFEVNKDIIVFSLLPNMAFFYLLFFQWKIDETAKGLVIVTLILGGLSFLLTS